MKGIYFLLGTLVLSPLAMAYDGWSTGKVDRVRVQSARMLLNQVGALSLGKYPTIDYLYLPQGETAYHKNMYSAV